MGGLRWSVLVRAGLGSAWVVGASLGGCSAPPPAQSPACVAPVASVTASARPVVENGAPEPPANGCEADTAALDGAPRDSRTELLERLRDRCGGTALVSALDHVDGADPELAFSQTAELFRVIREYGDPRAAEALAVRATKTESVHWATEAATALAELGDLRAVAPLASRLMHDSQELYGSSKVLAEQALARDDRERVVAARLLADLAELHPEQRGDIRAAVEDPVRHWLDASPQPHANGMRVLAAAGCTRALPRMQAWAFPSGTLPAAGAMPPFDDKWVIAQSALRYLGRMRDERSWTRFEAQLDRRRTQAGDADVTMDALMAGGIAMQGMAVRALGYGAADGYAEWRDPRAVPILLRYIENPKENEQSRLEACRSVASLLGPNDALSVADKVGRLELSNRPKDQFIASCLAEGLAIHGQPRAQPTLLTAFGKTRRAEMLRLLARAIGAAPIADDVADKLLGYVADPSKNVDAVLALLLGARPEKAKLAATRLLTAEPDSAQALSQALGLSVIPLVEEDLTSGRLARRAAIAEALASLEIAGTPQTWAKDALGKALQAQVYDAGPLSLTRTVLLYRLRTALSTGSDAQNQDSLRILRLLGVRGILAAAGQ